MKASELIKHLQQQVEIFGDLEVETYERLPGQDVDEWKNHTIVWVSFQLAPDEMTSYFLINTKER